MFGILTSFRVELKMLNLLSIQSIYTKRTIKTIIVVRVVVPIVREGGQYIWGGGA